MTSRQWVTRALSLIAADANRSADTHLHIFPLSVDHGIDLYLKDESVHPTGSLKHRLARSLVLYGLVNGEILENTTLVDATSGSTAISEAYFAHMLHLPFIAVMPRDISAAKVSLVEQAGGRCHFVESAADVYAEAERLGAQREHYYLDQFGNAAVVNDWRGNNTIASSIFEQMALERHPIPCWIVVGAGTGGTSATIGRYCRYRGVETKVALVDPEGSVFHAAWQSGDRGLLGRGSRIEGIGRPRVEPSFVPGVIDEVLPVADAASIAGMRLIDERLGRRVGPSTGTNVAGALELIDRMRRAGERGSVVTLICDSGDRYGSTYWDEEWVLEQGWSVEPELTRLRALLG